MISLSKSENVATLCGLIQKHAQDDTYYIKHVDSPYLQTHTAITITNNKETYHIVEQRDCEHYVINVVWPRDRVGIAHYPAILNTTRVKRSKGLVELAKTITGKIREAYAPLLKEAYHFIDMKHAALDAQQKAYDELCQALDYEPRECDKGEFKLFPMSHGIHTITIEEGGRAQLKLYAVDSKTAIDIIHVLNKSSRPI